MPAIDIVRKTYRPVARVGRFYAAPYGSQMLVPMGNVLEASTEQAESVEEQQDMSALGGGLHSELRRVTSVMFKATLADLNIVNLSRALRATVAPQDAGTVVDAPYTASLGALIPLPHVGVTALVVLTGATAGAATVVPASGVNYELRPEGLWIPQAGSAILQGAQLWLSYSFADQVVLEALTAATPELYIRFAGLNEVESGKAGIVDMWRVSQGVAAQLALIQQGFTTLEIEGKLLVDPAKTGVGISRYMRTIEL